MRSPPGAILKKVTIWQVYSTRCVRPKAAPHLRGHLPEALRVDNSELAISPAVSCRPKRRYVSSHTLPKMLFACWRCSKFPAGKLVQPRFPKSECDRSCGTNPCLRPFCQEFGTLSFHSRCVCAHAMRLGFQLVGIGSFFLVRFGFPDGFPQRSQSHESTQEAIITRGYFSASMFVFGITSPDTLEQLIQNILLNTDALKHLWGHHSKCEHLTARSKPPLCVARVVGTLPALQ